MAEVIETKNGYDLYCDCGRNHSITMENDEIILTTKFQKPKAKKENEPVKTESSKENPENTDEQESDGNGQYRGIVYKSK